MIRVIIERHLKEGEKVTNLLRELRAAAMHYPGYITGETLVNTEDKSLVAVISTWHSLEDWNKWEKSETRAKLYRQIEPLLTGKPKVTIFRIIATEEK